MGALSPCRVVVMSSLTLPFLLWLFGERRRPRHRVNVMRHQSTSSFVISVGAMGAGMPLLLPAHAPLPQARIRVATDHEVIEHLHVQELAGPDNLTGDGYVLG